MVYQASPALLISLVLIPSITRSRTDRVQVIFRTRTQDSCNELFSHLLLKGASLQCMLSSVIVMNYFVHFYAYCHICCRLDITFPWFIAFYIDDDDDDDPVSS